ncbi:MAG: lipoyl(octanoyl) transferase LipB [Hahellaceae bacterium]|nr:lipoyl(octanoyl) transferase LipB [Hahellaceae bacterium]
MELTVYEAGELPYEPVWQAMQHFTQTRTSESADQVWMLQHPPVFTQGQAGRPEHLLMPGDIPVVQVDRGGQVTYHGPGQLVVYPLLDIGRLKLGARSLVTLIEDSLVELLAKYDIPAAARPDAPGVYVGEAKIASLGLRIRRNCSFHGLALNVSMDLSPFQRINPCGYAGMQMTQMQSFVPDIDVSSVARTWLNGFLSRLPYTRVTQQVGPSPLIDFDSASGSAVPS